MLSDRSPTKLDYGVSVSAKREQLLYNQLTLWRIFSPRYRTADTIAFFLFGVHPSLHCNMGLQEKELRHLRLPLR